MLKLDDITLHYEIDGAGPPVRTKMSQALRTDPSRLPAPRGREICDNGPGWRPAREERSETGSQVAKDHYPWQEQRFT